MGIRSPDVSRKQLASPKFGHKINFFQPDKEDFTNNNKDLLTDRLVLEVLKEDEEPSDAERKCEGHLRKIQELEIAVASGQTSLHQVTESLAKVEVELSRMSMTLERGEREILRLKTVIKEQESKEEILQERLSRAKETIEKQEENLLNYRLKEEDLKAVPPPDHTRALDDTQATKGENRKIRDQLKLQVQERKLLLKKISMLKEQLGSVSDAKSDLDCKNRNVSKKHKRAQKNSKRAYSK